MNPMRLSLAAFAAVVLTVVSAPRAAAQDDNSPARLWLDLEASLPRRIVGSGKEGPRNNPNAMNPVDWSKTLDAAGLVNGRAQNTPVEPYALFYLASFNFNAGNIDEASALFEGLQQQFPDHPLCKAKLAGSGASLVAEALVACAEEAAWVKRFPREKPKEPELDPKLRAVVTFPQGDVVFGFYKNVAPLTVAQFLKNTKDGAYAGAIVGRIQPDFAIRIGDKEAEKGRIVPSEQGKSSPPIPLEFSKATHRRGTLSMMRNLGQQESHGVLFEVILKDQAEQDFQRTVFGEVISGIEIIDAISRQGRDNFEYPANTVMLRGMRISE